MDYIVGAPQVQFKEDFSSLDYLKNFKIKRSGYLFLIVILFKPL